MAAFFSVLTFYFAFYLDDNINMRDLTACCCLYALTFFPTSKKDYFM